MKTKTLFIEVVMVAGMASAQQDADLASYVGKELKWVRPPNASEHPEDIGAFFNQEAHSKGDTLVEKMKEHHQKETHEPVHEDHSPVGDNYHVRQPWTISTADLRRMREPGYHQQYYHGDYDTYGGHEDYDHGYYGHGDYDHDTYGGHEDYDHGDYGHDLDDGYFYERHYEN